MGTLLQDIRFALRQLRSRPGFSATVVLILAFGIGANTAIFTLIHALLLRPLPYHEPERLVILSERSPVLDEMSVAYLNFLDWREQNQAFEGMTATRYQNYNWTSGERPERVQAAQTSADMFSVLGVQPLLGRGYRAADDRPGADPVAVLSYAFWQTRLGGDPAVLERNLTLDGQNYTVVGVMPASFRFPPFFQQVDLWVPLGLRADDMQQRGNHPGIYVIARLKPGVASEQARADMDLIARRLSQLYPDTNANNGVQAMSLHKRITRDFRPALLTLWAAVGLVLLIACANVANLLLARGAARRQEIAVRAALGAGRARLLRQLLTESILLALVAGLLGALLAIAATDLLIALLPTNAPGMADQVRIDPQVLLFTAVVALLTGLLFGIFPAVQVSGTKLQSALKEGAKSLGGGFRRHALRKILVVAEVALAVVLLIGAGLMLRSFWMLSGANPGFDPENVLTLEISLPSDKYSEPRQRADFFRRLLDRVGSLAGVEAAGVSTPLLGGWQTSFYVEGTPVPPPGEGHLTDIGYVSPDYLRAMRIPLLRGRYFTPQDREDAPLVAIVDETFAKKYWPDGDPIGKRLKTGASIPSGDQPWRVVVGVVGHVKNYGITEDSRIETYLPYYQDTPPTVTLALRTVGDPENLAAAVRHEVSQLDPEQPIHSVQTMEQYMANAVANRRAAMLLLTLFAAVALLLASIGIYGVLAYSVSQSTHEIGIRMALGALPGDVLGWVFGHGFRLIALGLVLGLGAALALSRLISSQLFGVRENDPLTFGAVALLLAAVASLACYWPARRATRVDPMLSLRYE